MNDTTTTWQPIALAHDPRRWVVPRTCIEFTRQHGAIAPGTRFRLYVNGAIDLIRLGVARDLHGHTPEELLRRYDAWLQAIGFTPEWIERQRSAEWRAFFAARRVEPYRQPPPAARATRGAHSVQ